MTNIEYVRTGGDEYPVHIGFGSLANTELLQRYVTGSQVLIVTNETVAPLYLEPVRSAFASLQCDEICLPDGEEHKNQRSLFSIYDKLIHNHHHRDTTLVALGGGVIGDITGFAAATYQRGVHCIQIPTTLMAQVDASIGGKTAINHAVAKNMMGCFHQPQAVIMDLDTLSTLPEREFQSSVAEVIKYALLTGGDFLTFLHDTLIDGLSSQSSQLPTLIAWCCRIKASYVQTDEREVGIRTLLNLGHTIGHALEAYTKYQRWLHGEAVAIGLYCAAFLSYQEGVLTRQHLDLVDALLSLAQLPRRIPLDVDLQALLAYMVYDKKAINHAARLVLMRSPGDCYLADPIPDLRVLNGLGLCYALTAKSMA